MKDFVGREVVLEGALLMLGCAGYLVQVFGGLLWPEFDQTPVATVAPLPAALGEIGIALWLHLLDRRMADRLRTALLSNSWGNEYPRDGWDDMFDAAVISHEVGMRKPHAEIYLHACELLAVQPSGCLYVGDGAYGELTGAAEVGIVEHDRRRLIHVEQDVERRDRWP